MRLRVSVAGSLAASPVIIRVVVSWGLGLTVFFFVWALSYWLLPEGVVRGRTLAGWLAPWHESLSVTFLHILSFNLLIGWCGVIYMNRFRASGVPMGYAVSWIFWAFYGLLLGTNSFTYPDLTKHAPSLSILWGRSGLFEMTAYAIAAAATAGLWHEADAARARWPKAAEAAALLMSMILLSFAALREARQLSDVLKPFP